MGAGNTPGGLWGLIFGSGAGNGGDANTLYFLDGINSETAGLFGAISVAASGAIVASSAGWGAGRYALASSAAT